MKIGIANDHAGVDYKNRLVEYLTGKGYEMVNCGTGNGINMTLNKHQGIRAGLCWTPEIGKLIKQHNNANVLVMPARFIPFETVVEITDAWLDEEFEGGRHQGRIDKIPCK